MAPKRPFKIKPMQKAMKRLKKEIRQFGPGKSLTLVLSNSHIPPGSRYY